MTGLIERLLTLTEDQRTLADEVLFACGWQTNFDRERIEEVRANGWKCEGECGEEYIDTFEAFMDCACWYPPGNKPFKDAWVHGHTRPNPLASIEDAIALIPADLYWLIAKGRMRPTEPLYGVQLLRPGSEIPIAESEHEDGPTAICVAVL